MHHDRASVCSGSVCEANAHRVNTPKILTALPAQLLPTASSKGCHSRMYSRECTESCKTQGCHGRSISIRILCECQLSNGLSTVEEAPVLDEAYPTGGSTLKLLEVVGKHVR